MRNVVEDTGAKRLHYLYDFGDGWEHTIQIERIEPAQAGVDYPRLLDAQGRCPPEDVGGPPGYAEYLEALADPEHERHAEMIEWRGTGFDPKAVDVAAITSDLLALARKWSRARKPKQA